jgi:hypothetical protein
MANITNRHASFFEPDIFAESSICLKSILIIQWGKKTVPTMLLPRFQLDRRRPAHMNGERIGKRVGKTKAKIICTIEK